MITEPFNLTIGADVVSMKRINQDGYASEYFGRLPDDSEVRMKIRHTSQKAKGSTPASDRHSAELMVTKVTTSGTFRYQAYFVFIVPFGGSVDLGLDVTSAILGFGTPANLGQLADWAS